MKKLYALPCLLFASGCVSSTIPAGMKPVSIQNVVNHVQCEIYDASISFPALKKDQWIAAVALTLQTDASGGLTPTFAAGNVLGVVGTAKVNGGFGLTKTSSKIFTENFIVDIAKLDRKVCAGVEKNGKLLAGDLGITQTVDAALTSMRPDPHSGSLSFAKEKTFAQTLKFTVDMRVTALGPTWTLEHFVGPGGFLTAYKTDFHTLDIAFTQKPATPIAAPGAKANQSAAQKAFESLQQLQMLRKQDN